MTIESRLNDLERMVPPDGEPFKFTFAPSPPEGLTRAEQEDWRAEQRREAEERGVFYFTLDLGAAAIRQGDDE